MKRALLWILRVALCLLIFFAGWAVAHTAEIDRVMRFTRVICKKTMPHDMDRCQYIMIVLYHMEPSTQEEIVRSGDEKWVSLNPSRLPSS